MVTRKIQIQNGAFFSNIPKALIDSLGLRRGDRVNVRLVGEEIIITPVKVPDIAGVAHKTDGTGATPEEESTAAHTEANETGHTANDGKGVVI